jgi:hypothetical protein
MTAVMICLDVVDEANGSWKTLLEFQSLVIIMAHFVHTGLLPSFRVSVFPYAMLHISSDADEFLAVDAPESPLSA